MKRASFDVDEDQSIEGSYKHAMRAPGQSVNDAYISAALFVMESVLTARELQTEYMKNGGKGFSPHALYAIGIGLHTVIDNTSPAHTGYQVWHGLSGGYNLLRAAQHALRENSITTAQQTLAIKDGRALFQMAFGKKLSDVAFKAHK
jgi:hypothetical protein